MVPHGDRVVPSEDHVSVGIGWPRATISGASEPNTNNSYETAGLDRPRVSALAPTRFRSNQEDPASSNNWTSIPSLVVLMKDQLEKQDTQSSNRSSSAKTSVMSRCFDAPKRHPSSSCQHCQHSLLCRADFLRLLVDLMTSRHPSDSCTHRHALFEQQRTHESQSRDLKSKGLSRIHEDRAVQYTGRVPFPFPSWT